MIEVLWEVWRITERRQGCIYKTKFVERRWVPLTEKLSRPDNNPDLVWVTPDLPYDEMNRIVLNKKSAES